MEKNDKEINDKLPIIDWTIDEFDMAMGLDTVSVVSQPAIEIDYIRLNKETPIQLKKDKMRRVITGPVMLADTLIYRSNPQMGEYYGKFSKETIEKMVIKYFKDGKTHRVNEEHDSKKQVSDIYMFESYIVGDTVKNTLFSDLPDGSWVASFYVENEKYWNDKIMSDNFKGFSLEGAFFEEIENKMEKTFNKYIENILNSDINEEESIEKIKELFKST